MNNINLIPKKQSVRKKYERFLHVYRFSSFLLLSLVGFLSISFFLLQLTSPLNEAHQKEADLKQQLSLMQEKITKVVVLHQRLLEIDDILKKRPTVSENINGILRTKSKSVKFLSLQATQQDIIISGNGTSLKDIDDTLNNIVDLVINKHIFKRITLNALNYNKDDQVFIFSVTLTTL